MKILQPAVTAHSFPLRPSRQPGATLISFTKLKNKLPEIEPALSTTYPTHPHKPAPTCTTSMFHWNRPTANAISTPHARPRPVKKPRPTTPKIHPNHPAKSPKNQFHQTNPANLLQNKGKPTSPMPGFPPIFHPFRRVFPGQSTPFPALQPNPSSPPKLPKSRPPPGTVQTATPKPAKPTNSTPWT